LEQRTVLIFGGAGFIGSNWASHLLEHCGARVHIFDNLSRKGSQHNLKWLKQKARYGYLDVTIGDVRDFKAVREVATYATEIYQFAAQVAVTDSVEDPRHDLEVNLQGTFNVLEAARLGGRRPLVLFTSTNKVYGECENAAACGAGVSEAQALDFHSPYGCSKGAADQYVRDYARIYNLPTVVFRMSCIAGPRQWGNEDQGWVAHFVYSALQDAPITIYGDGRQVRDVLHVQDLLRAFEAARQNVDGTTGEIYNVGGGSANAVSLLDVVQKIRRATFRRLEYVKAERRPGDQQVYVTDFSKLTAATGWVPQHSMDETLRDIELFWHANRELFTPRKVRTETAAVAEVRGAA
jgi:CDP-paratose 2-epimerase